MSEENGMREFLYSVIVTVAIVAASALVVGVPFNH